MGVPDEEWGHKVVALAELGRGRRRQPGADRGAARPLRPAHRQVQAPEGDRVPGAAAPHPDGQAVAVQGQAGVPRRGLNTSSSV
ncbi:hypothetical protein ACFSTC_14535 [Nonomuraea ferruginea]